MILPDDIREALEWWQDTDYHDEDRDAPGNCWHSCRACMMEQTKWKHITDARRNLLQEVCTKYGI